MKYPYGRRKEGFILEKRNRGHWPPQLSRPQLGWAGQSTSICHPCLFGKEHSAAQIPHPSIHCHCLVHWCKCLWGCSMKWARESIQVKNDHASPLLSQSPSFRALLYSWISFLFLLDGWHCSSGDDTSEGAVGVQSGPSGRHHWVPKSLLRTDCRPKGACA